MQDDYKRDADVIGTAVVAEVSSDAEATKSQARQLQFEQEQAEAEAKAAAADRAKEERYG